MKKKGAGPGNKKTTATTPATKGTKATGSASALPAFPRSLQEVPLPAGAAPANKYIIKKTNK
jgi:hypothetical protein